MDVALNREVVNVAGTIVFFNLIRIGLCFRCPLGLRCPLLLLLSQYPLGDIPRQCLPSVLQLVLPPLQRIICPLSLGLIVPPQRASPFPFPHTLLVLRLLPSESVLPLAQLPLPPLNDLAQLHLSSLHSLYRLDQRVTLCHALLDEGVVVSERGCGLAQVSGKLVEL